MRHVGGSELLDREPELELVRRVLTSARSGVGAVLIIEGDSGIGKTTLIRAAVQLARDQGACVLTARGGELEEDLPFGVVRELFANMASPNSGGHTAAWTGAAKLAEPALAGVPEPENCDSFSILHGLYWLTAGLTEAGPAVLVVDDLHWCDLPSLRFLSYLARRIESLPVIILVAVLRDADVGAQEILNSLAAEPLSEVVRLRELGRSAVSKLISHELGRTVEPEFSEACRRATRGNPFLVLGLAAAIGDSGIHPVANEIPRVAALAPQSVGQSVSRQLGRLPAAAAILARTVAILGDCGDLSIAAAMTGIPKPRAAELTDTLVRAGLLARDRNLTFVHPIVRSALYNSVGPGELAAAHRRAADLLIGAGASNEMVVPHILAGETCSDPRAVEVLVEQARHAQALGSPETAARYLRRALGEPPTRERRADVLLELGIAETAAGLPEAAAHLESCVEETTDPIRRGQACLSLAKVLLIEGRIVDTVEVCRRGLSELSDASPELALELEAERFAASRHELSIRPIVTKEFIFRTTQATSGGRAEAILLANLALDEAYNLGSRQRVIELAEAALARDWLFQPDALATLPTALVSLAVSGRAQHARQIWDEAIARHRQRGEVRGFAVAAAFRGHTAYLLGDLGAAIADGRSGLDLAREHGMVLVETHAVAFLVRALTESGELEAAEKELIDHATRRSPEASRTTSSLLSARGRLRLAQGRLEDAVSDLRECERSLAAWGWKNPWLIPFLTPLAEGLYGLGERAAAGECAKSAVRLARQWGTPGPLADSLRVSGLISRGNTGAAQLREAAAIAESADSPLEHARVLVSLGTVLRRSGRSREAREPLRQALDRASSCGARLIGRLANDELVASGAQPRRLRTTGVDSLTPSERRVAAMVAGGMTNRAVAQAQFVSEKTIETHLAHAYQKLQINSRSQLASVLDSDWLGSL